MRLIPALFAAFFVLGVNASAATASIVSYDFSGSDFGPSGSAGAPSLGGLTLAGSFTVDVNEANGTINNLLAFSLVFNTAPPTGLTANLNFGLADMGFNSVPAEVNPNAGINNPPRANIFALPNGQEPLTSGPGGDLLLRLEHIADPSQAILTQILVILDENATIQPPPSGLQFLTSTLYLTGNTTLTPAAVPLPAAAWLFGSGLVGLIGLSRRKSVRKLLNVHA